MNRSFLLLLLCGFSLISTVSAQTNEKQTPGDRVPTAAAIKRLEKDIPELMKRSDIPGMSAALVRDGKIVWAKGFGVMNVATNEPVTNDTIFEANSLSKPVFAYSVLKLVDDGKLDLDTPVVKYMDPDYNVSDDPRIKLVTVRMLLSNSSGLEPSKTDPQNKMGFEFPPGTKFHYAPIGFNWLGHVIEKVTGKTIEDHIRETVLEPLGMKDSSFIWLDKYDKLRAYAHNWYGTPRPDRFKWTHGASCCSLQTTPSDYARFVIGVMDHKILKRSTWDQMIKPQIRVGAESPEVAWGLGWGLETTAEGESLWHWGHGTDCKDYITAFLPKRDAVVFFANSENGLFFSKEIVDDALGGSHPGISYLSYQRYDSPSWLLLKDIVVRGSMIARADYIKQREINPAKRLSESQINTIGGRLQNVNKIGDAIEVFKQNTIDFPQSANTWDSLAGAYAAKGDKAKAIENYGKSLKLDPQNKNAADMLKKLKAE